MRAPSFLAAWASVGLLTVTSLCAQPLAASDPRRSGFFDMGPATQAMQRDDSANPGILSILQGERLWHETAGEAQRACAACHGEPAALKGVATRYPAFDSLAARPVTLAQRINLCRQRHQRAEALATESTSLLALTALIGYQSRGQPISPPQDSRLDDYRERGRARFNQRIGQLNFSCRDCHDTLAGRRLGASLIPQAHPTGYPIYRLEWQSLGSLPRRLRNCMTGVRADPFGADAIEMVELELYLSSRAAGMPVETPAVRP